MTILKAPKKGILKQERGKIWYSHTKNKNDVKSRTSRDLVMSLSSSKSFTKDNKLKQKGAETASHSL